MSRRDASNMRVFLDETGAPIYMRHGTYWLVDGTKSADMAAARRAGEALQKALPEDAHARATALCDGLYAEADIHAEERKAAWGVNEEAYADADRAEDHVREMASKLRDAGALIFGRNWYIYLDRPKKETKP